MCMRIDEGHLPAPTHLDMPLSYWNMLSDNGK
jgi:hypothetical protein